MSKKRKKGPKRALTLYGAWIQHRGKFGVKSGEWDEWMSDPTQAGLRLKLKKKVTEDVKRYKKEVKLFNEKKEEQRKKSKPIPNLLSQTQMKWVEILENGVWKQFLIEKIHGNCVWIEHNRSFNPFFCNDICLAQMLVTDTRSQSVYPMTRQLAITVLQKVLSTTSKDVVKYTIPSNQQTYEINIPDQPFDGNLWTYNLIQRNINSKVESKVTFQPHVQVYTTLEVFSNTFDPNFEQIPLFGCQPSDCKFLTKACEDLTLPGIWMAYKPRETPLRQARRAVFEAKKAYYQQNGILDEAVQAYHGSTIQHVNTIGLGHISNFAGSNRATMHGKGFYLTYGKRAKYCYEDERYSKSTVVSKGNWISATKSDSESFKVVYVFEVLKGKTIHTSSNQTSPKEDEITGGNGGQTQGTDILCVYFSQAREDLFPLGFLLIRNDATYTKPSSI